MSKRNQQSKLPLLLMTLISLSACYDELRPPECFMAPDTSPTRNPDNSDTYFYELLSELRDICIRRTQGQEFKLTQCEDLWLGKLSKVDKRQRYRQYPYLLTLQIFPLEDSPLYARCLPNCEPGRCGCEAHEDCGEGERCVGPLALSDYSADSEQLAFCVPKCTEEQMLTKCDADTRDDPTSVPYCKIGEGPYCYPTRDPVPEDTPELPVDQTPINESSFNVLELVDPMVGTGSSLLEAANVTPAASAPNGMTLVGPDTTNGSGMPPPAHYAGYYYHDEYIQGFSHTHGHGMGVADYGGISVMPRYEWMDEYQSFQGRKAPFSHDQEQARPGEYSVRLQDDETSVKIVATPHGAHHQYSFEASTAPELKHVVILDLGDNLAGTQTLSAQLAAEGNEISATQVLDGAYSGRYGGAIHHAVLRFDPQPESYKVWSDEGALTEGESASGRTAGIVAYFDGRVTKVDLTVGLSFVDLEGARRNLDAEHPSPPDIETTLQSTQALWRAALMRLRVQSKDNRMSGSLSRFVTAHYHSLLMPSLHSDVDGRYRGLDQEVHQLPEGERYYSDLSLWDTFRTLHSFYLLVHPRLQRDILRSLVRMSRDGGSLPRWPLAHGYTGGMTGSPAAHLFAEAYLKGLKGWVEDDDKVEASYLAALAQSDNEANDATRDGGEAYDQLGWVPADEHSGAASKTLEYAWADASLLKLAEALDRSEEERERLKRRASSWQALWDPSAGGDEGGFMVGRDASDELAPLSSLTSADEVYTEGNAWHYLWYVPYDFDAMIELQHEGAPDGDYRAAFLERYRSYWERVRAEPDDQLPDDYYWHGNEPVLHYAWLGSLAGDQQETIKQSHYVLESRYGNGPEDGLNGNDDSGTLSAWYLWAAMGLYPIAGGDRYALGAPIFERVELWPEPLDDGEDAQLGLLITAEGASLTTRPTETRALTRNEEGALIMGELLPAVISHEQLLQGLGFRYIEAEAED